MITQFTINLNKGEDIAEREARWRKRREVVTLAVMVIFVAVLVMINLQQYKIAESIITVKEQTIRQIDRQLDSLQKTGKNISKEDVLSLAKLEKERVLWTKKLLSLGELMPEEMALTYLEYKNQALLLRFISSMKRDEKEFDRVKEIVERLRNSPMFFRDFSEMRLREQHQTSVEDQTILSFSLMCQIDKSKRESTGGTSRRGGAASAAARSMGG